MLEGLSKFIVLNIDRIGVVLAAIFGAGVVLWQTNRQARANLKLQKENFKEELKLEIYRTLAGEIKKAGECLSKYYVTIVNAPSEIERYWKLKEEFGFNPTPIGIKSDKWISDYGNVIESVKNTTKIIEDYEIVYSNFKIYRKIIAYQNNRIQKINSKLFYEIIQYFPVNVTDDKLQETIGNFIEPKKPDQEKLELLKGYANKLSGEVMNLEAYLYDLSVTAQNQLLGNIFNHRLEYREVADSEFIVIKPDEDSIQRAEKFMETNSIDKI